MHMYYKYHSKDRNVFLGGTDKMDKILNMKKQVYFQIILENIKGNKKKRKAIIVLERVPYML